ncbi:hypothetical protein PUN28_018847 [Cardiocondyla obscurior]|uniref:Uncharacterized protein n=1 Tax=Cardiocondyla obscurior TaxID=286306 RepID=A0AAW2EI81_9HYME
MNSRIHRSTNPSTHDPTVLSLGICTARKKRRPNAGSGILHGIVNGTSCRQRPPRLHISFMLIFNESISPRLAINCIMSYHNLKKNIYIYIYVRMICCDIGNASRIPNCNFLFKFVCNLLGTLSPSPLQTLFSRLYTHRWWSVFRILLKYYFLVIKNIKLQTMLTPRVT